MFALRECLHDSRESRIIGKSDKGYVVGGGQVSAQILERGSPLGGQNWIGNRVEQLESGGKVGKRGVSHTNARGKRVDQDEAEVRLQMGRVGKPWDAPQKLFNLLRWVVSRTDLGLD